MSAVDTAITELQIGLTDLAPTHEGLRDFSRLNLRPETQADVQASIQVYDRRTGLMNAALDALTRLVADGYPALAISEVGPAVLADLEANKATIDAALGQFTATVPHTLGLTAGVPEPK